MWLLNLGRVTVCQLWANFLREFRVQKRNQLESCARKDQGDRVFNTRHQHEGGVVLSSFKPGNTFSFSVKYGTFDILQDEDVRQGLKKFSNWPTYPQLYVNSELIGGLDIVKVWCPNTHSSFAFGTFTSVFASLVSLLP